MKQLHLQVMKLTSTVMSIIMSKHYGSKLWLWYDQKKKKNHSVIRFGILKNHDRIQSECLEVTWKTPSGELAEDWNRRWAFTGLVWFFRGKANTSFVALRWARKNRGHASDMGTSVWLQQSISKSADEACGLFKEESLKWKQHSTNQETSRAQL